MKKANAIAILFLCIMAAGCGQKAVETTQSEREVFPAIELSNMDTTRCHHDMREAHKTIIGEGQFGSLPGRSHFDIQQDRYDEQ